MSVKIIVDRAGFDYFYGVFNTDKILDKEEIEKLFDKPSYQKMVELFGADVKFTEKAEFGKEVDLPKRAMGRVSSKVFSLPRLKGDCFVGKNHASSQ